MLNILVFFICFIGLFFVTSFCKTVRDTTYQGGDTILTVRYYDRENKLTSENRFVNNKKDGIQKDYYNNGKTKWFEEYLDGCPIKQAVSYYLSGRTERIDTYTNCRTEGLFVYLAENGDTLATGFSKADKPVGVHRAFYSNRKIKMLTHYDDNGKKHGLCETWREDGTRKDSTVYEHGIIIENRGYFYNGKPRYFETYKGNAIIEGSAYTPDGAVCGRVNNGNGRYFFYSTDSKTRYLRVYKDGLEQSSGKFKPGEQPALNQ